MSVDASDILQRLTDLQEDYGEDYKMETYKIETIQKLRELNSDFEQISKERLIEEYSRWSEQNFSASWIASMEEEFCSYAFKRPIDSWKKNERG